MKPALLRGYHALGPVALAALLVLAAAVVFRIAVIAPMQVQSEALGRSAPRAEAAPAATSADKLAQVYGFLKRDEQPTDWLAKLHGIAVATGVQVSSANYRAPQAEGAIVRYELVLPVAGSYAQIREFLKRAALEIPVMSIDQVQLRRDDRKAAALQGELRVTFHTVKS